MSSLFRRPTFSTFVVLIFLLLTETLGHPARRRPLPKIMDGNPARPGEFPYLVLLEAWQGEESTGRYEPICGGAILNPTTILSAAHCFLSVHSTSWRVVAGEYDLTRDEGTEQVRVLDRIVLREGFDFATYDNDLALALISADNPLHLDGLFASAISLPSSSYDSDLVGKLGRVAGWGSMDGSDLDFSPILNKVDLPLQSDEVCESVWGGAFTAGQKLCAGTLAGGRDTCHGDSGAPLVVDGVVVGIVSFGEGCGQVDRLGVYVRVSHYVKWIHHAIRLIEEEGNNL